VTATPPTTSAPPPFDPSKARVDWGVGGVQGTNAGSVRNAVARGAGQWSTCYQNALRAKGTRVDGGGSLSIHTDDTGRITSARVSGLGALPSLAGCIERSVMGLTIAGVDTGEASAVVQITLRPD
jgi:hypothetical protein